MTIELLEEIYVHCPGGVLIKPHNPNIPGDTVTIQAKASIKHPKHGTFQYAEIYVQRPTLKEALDSAAHLVRGYKQLVETAP